MLRIIIIPYILVEILLIALFIGSSGFLAYILEVILSAVFGGVLIFKFNIADLLSRLNSFSPKVIYSGFGMTIGAFLLFLPGILTDIIGIVAVVISLIFRIKNGNNTKFRQNTYNNTQNNTYNQEDIIDVEIIEEEKR